MDPAQIEARVLQADPALAAQTPDVQLQAALAAQRPDLWAALASNPTIYPDLRTWLATLGNGQVDAALAAQEASAPEAPTSPTTASVAAMAAGATEASVASVASVPDWDGEDTVVAGPRAAATSAAPAYSAPAYSAPAYSAAQVPNPVLLGSPGTLQPAGAGTRTRTGIMVLAIVLALALVGGAGGIGYWLSHSSGSDEATGVAPAAGGAAAGASADATSGASALAAASAGGQVTACDKDPVMTPTSVNGDAVSLTVTVSVKASCSGGDVLGGSASTVTVYAPSSTDGSGPADAVVALGTVDLSQDTLVVPPSGAQLELTFGSGRYFRLHGDLSTSHMTVTAQIDRATGATTATVPARPATVRVTTGDGDAGAAEAAAGAALRWQVDKDRATVMSKVNGHWVPQISSKRPGLVVNGTTYDNRSSLQDFYASRATYPEALLLYSDDWSVFDAGGHWWVTVVNQPSANPEAANQWCDAKGIPADDCFAKYIDPNGSSEGSVRMRK